MLNKSSSSKASLKHWCCFRAVLHFLKINDKHIAGILHLCILWCLQIFWPFDSQPVKSVILLKQCLAWSQLTEKQWIICLLSLYVIFPHLPSIKMCLFFLWLCRRTSFSFPAAIYFFSLAFNPSITIHDPQMTPRDSSYLRRMHSSISRLCYGEIGKRRRG